MTTSTGTSLVDEIAMRAGGDPRVELSMLMGALLEGGSLTGPWSPNLSDPNGGSWGPFQINGGGPRANDPAYAVDYMLPRYQQAVAMVDPQLWRSDPKLAAAQAVALAERPLNYQLGAAAYPAPRIQSAWDTLARTPAPAAVGPGGVQTVDLGSLLDKLLSLLGALGSGAGSVAGGIFGGIQGLGDLIATLRSGAFWFKVGLTLGAVLLIGLGALLLLRRPVEQAQEKAERAAPLVAMAAA
ncbi:MAG: hypothetical protein KGK07_13535 [Chloroflexota bacterium]|nr:hypothetical protein [Chloroflexota bacterium]